MILRTNLVFVLFYFFLFCYNNQLHEPYTQGDFGGGGGGGATSFFNFNQVTSMQFFVVRARVTVTVIACFVQVIIYIWNLEYYSGNCDYMF